MKIDPAVLRSSRAAQVWAAALALTFAGLVVMVGASLLIFGPLSPLLGRGVYFMLILTGVIVSAVIGLCVRWLAKGL